MHIVLKYYQNFTGFGDSNVSACDPKVGRDPPVNKGFMEIIFRKYIWLILVV